MRGFDYRPATVMLHAVTLYTLTAAPEPLIKLGLIMLPGLRYIEWRNQALGGEYSGVSIQTETDRERERDTHTHTH